MSIIGKTHFANLRLENNHASGDVAVVAKRWIDDPDSDGGGEFIYHSTLTDADDDATIIKPNDVNPNDPGRWKRQVDGAAHAEWFGAKGNTTTDLDAQNNLAAINSCLLKYGHVQLLAKTYAVQANPTGADTILLQSNFRIEGQGIDKTRIIMKQEASEAGPITGRVVFQTYPYGTPSDNVVIRDLTIDCGFDRNVNNDPYYTRMAINLRGAFNVVERVKAVNFIVGRSNVECFVIALRMTPTNTLGTKNDIAGVIQECIITDPANNGGLHYPAGQNIAELTLITLGGDSSTYVSFGGRIARNKIHYCKWDTTNLVEAQQQRSPLHGISVGNCKQIEIEDNEIMYFDGAAVYIGSDTDQDTLVRNNRMVNVNIGVGVNVNSVDEKPFHLGIKVTDNVIILGKYNEYSGQMTGIGAFIASGIAGANRLTDFYIQRNYIYGRKEPGNVPFGIWFFCNSLVFDNLNVEDNIVEIPDSGNASDFNPTVPYENAIAFMPWWAWDASRAKIKVHGNRNLQGTDVRLKIVDVAGGKSYWGPFSTRLARFKSPVFDGRSGFSYDEFTGLAPAFALGQVAVRPAFALSWEAVRSDDTASVGAASGEQTRPGVVKLSTGTLPSGSATLKYADNSVVLLDTENPHVNTGQVVEFGLKRSYGSGWPDYFECRMGFVRSADDVGVYFKFDSQTNHIIAVCKDASGEQVIDTNMFDWGETWQKYRMEILSIRSNLPQPLDDEVRFFVNDTYVGTITLDIPTVPLYFAFRIFNVPGNTGTTDRSLSIDYFQHQMF